MMLRLIKNEDEFVAVKLLQYVVCFEKTFSQFHNIFHAFCFFHSQMKKVFLHFFPLLFPKTHIMVKEIIWSNLRTIRQLISKWKSVFYQPVVKIVRDQAL